MQKNNYLLLKKIKKIPKVPSSATAGLHYKKNTSAAQV